MMPESNIRCHCEERLARCGNVAILYFQYFFQMGKEGTVPNFGVLYGKCEE